MSLQQGITTLKSYLPDLPSKPGVYRMVNEKGKVLYVGKAKALAKRVAQYTHGERLAYRMQLMVSQVASLEVTITDTEAEALLLI